eukprot:TRINITY_DN13398_c0_g1_i2.p1 TRINITY_DN13398_c0_g1~~TRINITY_DN13398_c0_g1_i2.p1  ORF type:complete len:322 (+),score=59.70 TRINITY_DN13398_c0_g1_i2:992-1957(+)
MLKERQDEGPVFFSPGDVDLRFVHLTSLLTGRGMVHFRSPLCQQGYEETLSLLAPSLVQYMHRDLSALGAMASHFRSNPSVLGFVFERRLLAGTELDNAIAANFLPNLPGTPTTVQFVGNFPTDKQLQDCVSTATTQPHQATLFRLQPQPFNYPYVDLVYLLFYNNKITLVGTQITLATAQEHAHSLLWATAVPRWKSALSLVGFTGTVECALLFVCQQDAASSALAVTREVTDDVNLAELHVYDGCADFLLRADEFTWANMFAWFGVTQPSTAFGLRELLVTTTEHGVLARCGCKKQHCVNRHCVCERAAPPQVQRFLWL